MAKIGFSPASATSTSSLAKARGSPWLLPSVIAFENASKRCYYAGGSERGHSLFVDLLEVDTFASYDRMTLTTE